MSSLILFKKKTKPAAKFYEPKALKQIARDDIKRDDEKQYKILAERMNKSYHFKNRLLKARFNVTSDSHHNIHKNSKLTFTPKYLETEKIRVNNIVKKRLI